MENYFEASLFDELEPLYPDTDPKKGKNLHMIAAASNTYAGVHIMLSGLTPGKFVTFEVISPTRKTVLTKDDGTIMESYSEDQRYKLFE